MFQVDKGTWMIGENSNTKNEIQSLTVKLVKNNKITNAGILIFKKKGKLIYSEGDNDIIFYREKRKITELVAFYSKRLNKSLQEFEF